MEKRRQPEIIAGRVNGADGGILAGDGFTSIRNSTGNYTITLPSSFRLISIVSAARNAGAVTSNVVSVTGNAVVVQTFTTSTGASADSDFSFVAAGVQQ